MINEIFIMKENGTCIASYMDENNDENLISEDLKTSMLTGIDIGIKEAFKGQVKSIHMNNGKKIYFSDCTIDESPVRIVVILDEKFNKYEKLSRMINQCLKSIEQEEMMQNVKLSASIRNFSFVVGDEMKEVQKKLKHIMESI